MPPVTGKAFMVPKHQFIVLKEEKKRKDLLHVYRSKLNTARDIRPYLEPGHTVHCGRGVLELKPLLQQVAAICKIQEGVIILHVVTSCWQE